MQDDTLNIPAELINCLTPEQAWNYMIIPARINCSSAEFFCHENSGSDEIIDELELIMGKKVILTPLEPTVINRALSKYYFRNQSRLNIPMSISKKDFLEEILKRANEFGSSDVHIEISEAMGRVRFRIDGRLEEKYQVTPADYPSLVNKIKISANLDIAEKRLPQDGRILYKTENENHDIRVSVLPTMFGEKIVLRLLRKTGMSVDIDRVGFSGNQLAAYLEGVKKPSGIILISGPTGSGKTTTLYATLSLLNKKDVNILTIEDPIEYTVSGINQVQLRDNIGLTYARALRTFLRQDPDIIMLGEIRDAETAEMAIRASLTGHLVLSTIHTNSAWGIVIRLTDMGIPPFLIADTLNTAVAQRLIRKLCPFCREQESFNPPDAQRAAILFKGIEKHYLPVGCGECRHTGYSGRIALFEVIGIDQELRDRIRISGSEIAACSEKNIRETLKDNAVRLFSTGVTSFEEVLPLILSDL